MSRRRYLCQNCGHAQRKGLICDKCSWNTQKVDVEYSVFAIGMWVFGAMWVVGLAVVLAAAQGGIILLLGFPFAGALLIAFILSFFDDDWKDRKARSMAEALARTQRHAACGPP